MACDLGIAVTCLAFLALTLQSGAVQISISLPAKTYTALPDIFDINCVAFSLNSSGVFTAEVAMARNSQLAMFHLLAMALRAPPVDRKRFAST